MSWDSRELTVAAGFRFYGEDFAKALNPVHSGGGACGGVIKEWYPGSWQRNDWIRQKDILCYPTLYACLNRISQDMGKLPYVLKQVNGDDIWQTVENPAYSPVLRKPNPYQTAQQFREAWILSKLIHGNTYILKGRDARGVVDRLYVLDPHRVMPLVSDSGDVFYQLYTDSVQGLLSENWGGEQFIVPAREIIHDRLNAFHHPLIGVPPVCAAYWPVAKNLNILKTASEFFANGAQPGGILTAPAGMSDADAETIRNYWNTNFQGQNSGKTAVIGADLKYQSFAFKSADSQLVEQMQYSDQQITQPFGIPPFKIGIGSIPAGLGVDAINQLYYADALQGHIEAMENLLDEGLAIPSSLGIWMDLEPLLRMDASKQAEYLVKLTDGIITPNEARKRLNYGPLEGGATVYMQQQDIPLSEAAKNTIQAPAPAALPAPQNEEPDPEEQARALLSAIEKRFAEA